jgi:hypothetical protein
MCWAQVRVPDGEKISATDCNLRTTGSMHCKKILAIPSPVGMSLNKISLAGNNLFPSRESLVSDIPAGDEKIANLFLQCALTQPAPASSQPCDVIHIIPPEMPASSYKIQLCEHVMFCNVSYENKNCKKRAWHMANNPLTFSVMRCYP